MTNPIEQIVGWMAEFGMQVFNNWETVSTIAAAGLALYLGFVFWQRLRDDSDPSLRLSTSLGAGSTSILLSGVHLTGLLAAGIALLTWPMAIERPVVGIGLVIALVAHYYLEKREVDFN